MLELLLSVLILIGAGFTLIGSLGLLRLRDFYSRLHAPTKATTLGVGSGIILRVMPDTLGTTSLVGNVVLTFM